MALKCSTLSSTGAFTMAAGLTVTDGGADITGGLLADAITYVEPITTVAPKSAYNRSGFGVASAANITVPIWTSGTDPTTVPVVAIQAASSAANSGTFFTIPASPATGLLVGATNPITARVTVTVDFEWVSGAATAFVLLRDTFAAEENGLVAIEAVVGVAGTAAQRLTATYIQDAEVSTAISPRIAAVGVAAVIKVTFCSVEAQLLNIRPL